MTGARVRERLRRELRESHRQAGRVEAPGFPREAFQQLQSFQRDRLARTYADLAERERYRPAVAFFLDELYGGRGGEERDRQVEQALPIMERTLPRGMQEAVADAFRLQAMSVELDIVLATAFHHRDAGSLDTALYAELYPEVPRDRREEQIALIHRLAMELDRVVHLPLVMGLIRAMRAPARAMGFGALQSFLEEGLEAFRTLRGAQTFADTIRERETRIMERLYAGEEDPFSLATDQTSQPK